MWVGGYVGMWVVGWLGVWGGRYGLVLWGGWFGALRWLVSSVGMDGFGGGWRILAGIDGWMDG